MDRELELGHDRMCGGTLVVQVSGETIATLCTSHPPSPQRPGSGYLSCNTSHPPSLSFTCPHGGFTSIFPGSCSCVWVSIVDLGLPFSCFPFCLELRRRGLRVQVSSCPVEPLDSVFLSLASTLGSTLPGCQTAHSTGKSSLRSSSGEEQNARF